ncbi:RNA12 protein [Rhizoctonia solani]|uniref:Mitochondrial escape protein 2 n=1 Tax=Rhizoctonia solani TaxID=456999 RepID=A0A8H7IEV6_9AGAM|nr:RNA12 protein [Rhizoctonia solani]
MAFSTLRLREPPRLQVFGRIYRANIITPQKRLYVDDALSAEISAKDSHLFPSGLINMTSPRYYFANMRKEAVIERVKKVLENTDVDGFKVLDIEPRIKDGGVFVHFEYISPLGSGTSEDPAIRLTELKSVADLQAAIQASAVKQGGIPSWLGFSAPRKFWLVRGRPWREDMTALLRQPSRPRKCHTKLVNEPPKDCVPVLAFLLGTITYTVFDPVREFSIRGRPPIGSPMEILHFTNGSPRMHLAVLLQLCLATAPVKGERRSPQFGERERCESDPSSVFERLAISDLTRRPSIIIDCAKILNTPNDSSMIRELATQTGYWPYFSFLTSLNNMIDLASVGLIGQKAGFSSTTESQLKDILISRLKLCVVSKKTARRTPAEVRSARTSFPTKRSDSVQRVDPSASLAQNAISGDEKYAATVTNEKEILPPLPNFPEQAPIPVAGRSGPEETKDDLPIVVITNYQPQGAKREEVLNVLAEWAAKLVEDKVAHVIFVCINRENTKRVAKALPSKPLTSIALSDADVNTARSYVISKLSNYEIKQSLGKDELQAVENLGGRISDLDTLVNKVRSGQSVTDAVKEIIHRGISEMRKNAFGDDLEDAKSLPWTREQAWSLLRALASEDEIPYANVLLEFPFKGDELALRNMETAELISIGAKDGLPTTIKPGKPVYKHVYRRLVQGLPVTLDTPGLSQSKLAYADDIFRAVQTINFNEKFIATSLSTIKACEDELTVLKEIGLDLGSTILGGKGATGARASYLLDKMSQATSKVEKLEAENVKLKKILAKVR